MDDDDDIAYYGTDAARLGFMEKWRVCSGNFKFFFQLVIAGLFGRRWSTPLAIAHKSLRFMSPADMPADIRARIRSIWDACEGLGFRPHSVHSVPVLGDADCYSLALVNRERTIVAQIPYVRFGQVLEKFVVFLSAMDDDTTLSTTNSQRRLATLPDVQVSFLTGAPVKAVLALHDERVERSDAVPRKLDDAAVRKFIVRLSRDSCKFHEERGVYFQLNRSQVKRLK